MKDKRPFFVKYFQGWVNLGSLTIYGENAMHWAVRYKTKRWGQICFRLPFRCFGVWHPLYFRLSPDGSSYASTFYVGPESNQCVKADERLKRLGHNFSLSGTLIVRQLKWIDRKFDLVLSDPLEDFPLV